MTASVKQSDRLLTDQLRTGNEAAFRLLYDRYRETLYGYSFRILKQRECAEEIVQDAFMKVWLNRQKIDPELSFKAYALTITRNLIYDSLKEAANDKSLAEKIFYNPAIVENSVEDMIDWEHYEQLKSKALATLPEKRRQIFILSTEDGLSTKEISEQLNISVSTVKTQVSRALDDIREYLHLHGGVALTFIFLVQTGF